MEKIVQEFIQTERVYCDFLEFTRDFLFAAVPLTSIKLTSERELVKNLITNWGQLHQFHTSFLLTLETRCLKGGHSGGGHGISDSGAISAVAVPNNNGPGTSNGNGNEPEKTNKNIHTVTEAMLKPNAAQGLANVVIKLAPYFKLYSTYTTLYPSAQKIIETTQNESSIFETAVKKFEALPRAQNLNVFSIMIKPLQRVCKYELFLRDLLKKTPTARVDLQTDIVMAMSKTKSIVGNVNNSSKVNENLAELADLAERLRPIGKVKDLLQSHRRLDLQGNAMAVQMLPEGESVSSSTSASSSKTSYEGETASNSDSDAALSKSLSTKGCETMTMFLVSDVLLLCRYKLKKKSMFRSVEKHRYHVAHEIPMKQVTVSPVDGSSTATLSEKGVGSFALEISTAFGKLNAPYFVVSFLNETDRQKWMGSMLTAIQKLNTQDERRRNSQARSSMGSMSSISSNRSSFRSPINNRRTSSGSTSSTTPSPRNGGGGSSGGGGGGGGGGGSQYTPSPLNRGEEKQRTPTSNGKDSTVVSCPHCNEILNVPSSAHVMKCHFCRKVFLHRVGRTKGKPVHRDGFLGVRSKSGMFGTKKIKSRYCVLTNTEISMFKNMDVFLTQGESSVKSLIPIDSHTTVRIKEYNIFCIETGGGGGGKRIVHELNAESEDDAVKWLRAIETAQSPRLTDNQRPPSQPRFAAPTLAPSHVEAYAPALPQQPRQQNRQQPRQQSRQQPRQQSRQQQHNTTNSMVVIPPGVDPDTFLSLPKDIQDKILSGEMGL